MFKLIVLSWVIIPVVVAFVVVLAIYRERKRRSALEEAATELGLTYTPKLDHADQEHFNRFPLAQIGYGRTASNAIVADSGELRMVLFDYVYSTGGGKSKSTHRQSVVLASSRSLKLPQFTIAPERFFHRIQELLGFKDIDFEDDVEFSKSFLLKGASEQAVREFFNSARRAAFRKFQQVSVQAQDESFIFFQARRVRGAQQLRELMQEGFTVYGALSAGDAV